ncbi:MAG: hypothetical protein ACK5Y2_07480 [Bdellovibrionales bacterium]
MKRFLIVFAVGLIAAGGLAGCTASTPDVSSLQDIDKFSTRSEGPYKEENPGQYFTVEGFCLNTVSGFALTLDDLPIATYLPLTPPTPNTALGEYLIESEEYDTDCSDFNFNFYVFYSQAMQNYIDNSVTREEPYKVSIWPISDPPLPPIVFERPRPKSVWLERNDRWNQIFSLERDQTQIFRIELRDEDKEETIAFDTDIPITLTATNLTSPASPAGSFYRNNCLTALSTADLTFSSVNGTRQIEICYKALNVQDGHMIQLSASAPSLETATWQFTGKAPYSATLGMRQYLDSTGVGLPPYLVKGVPYAFELSVRPLIETLIDTRSINIFRGTSRLASPIALIEEFANDPECEDDPNDGVWTCTSSVNLITKQFRLTVPTSYSGQQISIFGNLTPETACGTNCLIHEPPSTLVPIASYADIQIHLPVVTGGTTFTNHYFHAHHFFGHDPGQEPDGSWPLRVDFCQAGIVGAANSSLQLIAVPTSLNFSITTADGNVMFYDTYQDCLSNTSGLVTRMYPIPAHRAGAVFWYKPSTILPADKLANFVITETVTMTNSSRDYYLYVETDP